MNVEEQDEYGMPVNMPTKQAIPSDQGDANLLRAGTEQEAAAAKVTNGSPVPSGAIDVQAYIGRQLRAVYDDVVRQPIPDRLLALMKQLEEGTGER